MVGVPATTRTRKARTAVVDVLDLGAARSDIKRDPVAVLPIRTRVEAVGTRGACFVGAFRRRPPSSARLGGDRDDEPAGGQSGELDRLAQGGAPDRPQPLAVDFDGCAHPLD